MDFRDSIDVKNGLRRQARVPVYGQYSQKWYVPVAAAAAITVTVAGGEA
jgi:hypothetical protein